MFRTVFPSIIRSSNCTYSNTHMSNTCCYLLLALGKQQLFDIYCCCIRSFEPLMKDGKTVRNT